MTWAYCDREKLRRLSRQSSAELLKPWDKKNAPLGLRNITTSSPCDAMNENPFRFFIKGDSKKQRQPPLARPLARSSPIINYNHFKFSTKQLITLINTFQSSAPGVWEGAESFDNKSPLHVKNSDTFLLCLALAQERQWRPKGIAQCCRSLWLRLATASASIANNSRDSW